MNARAGVRMRLVGTRYMLGQDDSMATTIEKTGVYVDEQGNPFLLVAGEAAPFGYERMRLRDDAPKAKREPEIDTRAGAPEHRAERKRERS